MTATIVYFLLLAAAGQGQKEGNLLSMEIVEISLLLM